MSSMTTERENVPGFYLTLIPVSIIARGFSNAEPKQRLPATKIFLIFKELGYTYMLSFLINHSVLFTETFDIIRIIIHNIRNIWLIECGPYQSSPMSPIRAKTHNQIFILVVRLAITYLHSRHSHFCS